MRKLIVTLMSMSLPLMFLACLDTSVDPPDYAQLLANDLAAIDPVQLEADKATIDDSLELWDVQGVQSEPKGVRYTIHTLGTGQKPVLTSVLTFKYKARFLKDSLAGPVFDQSDNVQVYLYDLIPGFRTAMPLLPQGTKATLFIPSGLAYGKIDRKDGAGVIVIPKNSNLIFEVELTGVY